MDSSLLGLNLLRYPCNNIKIAVPKLIHWQYVYSGNMAKEGEEQLREGGGGSESFLLVFEESVEKKHQKIWSHGCYCKVILKVVLPWRPTQLFLKILKYKIFAILRA